MVDDLGSRRKMGDILIQVEATDVPCRQPRTSCELFSTGGASASAKICADCERFGDGLSFCNVCAIILCNACWDKVLPHRLRRRAPDDVPHEKTNYHIAEKIQAVLEPRITAEERQELHRKDENTTWFGVAKNEMEDIVFQDCGRYASLMASCSSRRRDPQYPGLVSFVGQTGRFACSWYNTQLIGLQEQGRVH